MRPNGKKQTPYPTARLDEVGVRVLDCEHKTPKFQAEGYPYIAIPNIRDGRLDLSDVATISSPDFIEWTRRTRPRAGDIVLTRRGRVGDTGVIPAGLECAIGQNLVILRSDNSVVDQRYLRWTLRGPSYEQQVDKWLNVGAVFDSLNVKEIPQIEIPIPPLPEQRAIAHILGTLEDKIELNRRMNQTLEEMARALFHSWFVAFDPVRAKAAGHQPAGMEAATAALFPDSFVQTEHGEIPAGWCAGKVSDFVRIAKKTLNPASFPGELFDHYSLPAFDSGRNPVIEVGSAIKSNKTIVESKAVLISKLNPHIPRVWLPDLSSERRPICSTEFLVAVPHHSSAQPFVYALFSSEPFTRAFASLVTGTTGSHQRVNAESLLAMRIVVPSGQVVSSFCHTVDPLFQSRARNRAQNITLAAIRDALLPKLLSGEVRVPEAQQGVADVAEVIA